MKKITRNNVRMYDAVYTILEAHQTVWSENPSFVAGVAQFKALFEELKTISIKHEAGTIGIKTRRSNYMNDLISKTMVIRDGIAVFTFENKMYEVSARLNFTCSKLKHLSQLELRNCVTIIYELILEHESQLVNYGITSEKIIGFMNVYEDFEKEIVALRKGNIERKFLTARIVDLEAEIKLLFDKKLDVLVRLLSIEQPEFFSSYKTARKLIEQTRSKSNVSPPPDDGTSDIGIAS